MKPTLTLHRLEDDRALIEQVIQASLHETDREQRFRFPVLAPLEAAALLRMVQEEQSREYVVLSRHE